MQAGALVSFEAREPATKPRVAPFTLFSFFLEAGIQQSARRCVTRVILNSSGSLLYNADSDQTRKQKPNNRNVNLRAQASAQDFSFFACARDFTLLDISLKETWQRRSPYNNSLGRGQIEPPVQADSTFCKCACGNLILLSYCCYFCYRI